MAMSSDDENSSLWGRTEEREFSYIVTVPSSNQQPSKVSLTAVQDREVCTGTPAFPSHGHCVWDAAMLLADYLQAKANNDKFSLQDKKVVELGAGVGLVGMTLAVLGAQVALTDQEYALPLLHKNVDVNFRQKSCKSFNAGEVTVPKVEMCQWGERFESDGSLETWRKNVDVVVFSDVLYHASAFLLLIETLHELTSPSTDVFFSYETRNKSVEANFLQQLRETFDVEEISRDDNAQVFDSFEYADELFIFHARRKADSKP
ncbi:hypothetical protein PHYBOEH_005766 [Phytophthora boehmeriae]|uniref:N2,N2-dimethylguanosine tRNA methyltransferase n=1 Tax=Phytophthora boehmeriae TaxID=109152 RepID=A0A8T1XDW5_9STRA|nr:hypothetical protein PHYBOEH_005766 [Phytophthora boehmeriae]